MLAAGLTGCATVELPDANHTDFKLLDDENRVLQRAAELSQQIEASGIVYDDPALQDYLTEILRSLWPDDTVPAHIQLEVRVTNDTNVNAYALPSGRVYVNSSSLALMRNRDQAASVLAHELIHVLERHALKVKRSTSNKAAWFNSVNVLAPISSVAAVSTITGYSRQVEQQADTRGVELMRHSGYDPRQMISYYERIRQYILDEDVDEPWVFSSHPDMDARIADLRRRLGMEDESAAGPSGADPFLAVTRAVRLEACRQWVRAGQLITAMSVLDEYLADHPEDTAAMVLQAQVYRRRLAAKGRARKPRAKDPADYVKALELVDHAVQIDAGDASAWFERGLLRLKLDDPAGAREAFQTYLSLEPGSYRRAFVEDLINGA